MTLQLKPNCPPELICCSQDHSKQPQFAGTRKLPKAVRETPRIGIQGGPGSFNEIALQTKGLKQVLGNPEAPETSYLYTSGDVFSKLEAGDIDVGHVAVFNSIGGLVDETMKAVSQMKVRVLGRYSIPIRHALMVRPDADLKNLSVVMGHPQALKQCETNLQKRHGDLAIQVGEGAMIDPAKIAEMLEQGRLDKNVAVLGNTALAEIYGLKVISEDLQDNPHNRTTFMVVAPPKDNSPLSHLMASVRQKVMGPHLRSLDKKNRMFFNLMA